MWPQCQNYAGTLYFVCHMPGSPPLSKISSILFINAKEGTFKYVVQNRHYVHNNK
jgi:hypothetical protein